MITPCGYNEAGKYMGAELLFGLSTDSKPTSYGNGSVFIEMDSSKIYFFDGGSGEWKEWEV